MRVGDHSFAYSSLTSVILTSNVKSIGYGSFESCLGLTSITIPGSVTNLGIYAFTACYNLTTAYFVGNAPHDDGDVFTTDSIAFYGDPTTAYYLPGTTGWGSLFGAAPAVLWNPRANTLGFTGGHFHFNLTGPTNALVVVEATTNLSLPFWVPVATNTFSGSGISAFTDSSSYPTRFYRIRSP